MSKYVELSFVEVIQPFFMNGKNMGNKIHANTIGCKMMKHAETKEIEVFYKGKVSTIGHGNVCSSDYKEVPDEVKALFGIDATVVEEFVNPKARKPEAMNMSAGYASQMYSPDDESPEAHRARVRAASANSNKAIPVGPQNDTLIQQARMEAMGIKHGQVSVPSMPTEGQTGVPPVAIKGKPKAISHQAMKAQVAQEMKDPNA